jgi:WD40 repeat protein
MKFQTANGEAVQCIDVAANGAVAVGTFLAYSSCCIYVVDQEGLELQNLLHNFSIAALKFCPTDSSLLVSVSDRIRLWNTVSGSLLAVVEPNDTDENEPYSPVEMCPFTGIDFAPDSRVFAVTDTRGLCSVWSAETNSCEIIEIFELGVNEKLLDVSFVASNFIACASETGNLFVIDRNAHRVICSNSNAVEKIMPRCQPVKLAWLHMHSLVAIAHQTSGVVSVFEFPTLDSSHPKLIGSTRNGDSIADISWDKVHPQYLVVARDSGIIQVFHIGNLDSPHFDCKIHTGASALAWTADGALLIGTVSGEVVKTSLPDTLRSGGVRLFSSEECAPSFPALA